MLGDLDFEVICIGILGAVGGGQDKELVDDCSPAEGVTRVPFRDESDLPGILIWSCFFPTDDSGVWILYATLTVI